MARGLLLIIGLISLCKIAACEEESRYDNYELMQLLPVTEQQQDALREFPEFNGTAEVLKRSYGVGDSLDVLVPPALRDAVRAFAAQHAIEIKVKHEDFRRTLEESQPLSSRRALQSFNLFGYNSYDNIQEYLESLAAKYPSCVRVETAGQSYERRPMKLVKISNNPEGENPVIMIDAGIHAREWVAPAMALYLIQRLADSCNLGADRKTMLSGVDWYILPVVNPDGYEFSRNGNRMWRKTRSKHNSQCYGVDGNRNYGLHWGVSGTSSNPCDPQTYPGPQPFSESETRAVRDVMLSNSERIKLYVSLHAYGQYLVYPWGYTGAYLPKNWKNLDTLAKRVSAAVVRAGGQPFRVMSAGQWYPAAGGSDDFAFGVAKIPYSYTMELTDGYEFTFPENRLRSVLPTFYDGFKVFKTQIQRQFN